MLHGSSLLLDLDGVVVESVQRTVEGSRIVHIATAPQWVGICPECGQRSSRSKGWVTTTPRDVQVGPDRPKLVWNKRKWLCINSSCERRVFTESTPGVPPRTRVTPRAKALLAEAVLDGDRSVSAVAGDYKCAWHTVHNHLVMVADAALAGEPEPVLVLGIDETRRGKARWETDPDTGARSWVDRWDTGLVDILGDQGLLAQVNGRTSAVVTNWLDDREEAWKSQITHVAIDMSAVYAKAVREALPNARLVVDRFHLVKKANEMVDTVRRRVTQAERGRRGRKSDVEWINRRRLLRASERLTGEQRSTLFEKLTEADPDRPHQSVPSEDFTQAVYAGYEHAIVARTCRALAAETRSSDDCYFAIWAGYSGVLSPLPGAPRMHIPNRDYHLYVGSLSDLKAWEQPVTHETPALHHDPPAFVWPADRAWCLASDVDAPQVLSERGRDGRTRTRNPRTRIFSSRALHITSDASPRALLQPRPGKRQPNCYTAAFGARVGQTSIRPERFDGGHRPI